MNFNPQNPMLFFHFATYGIGLEPFIAREGMEYFVSMMHPYFSQLSVVFAITTGARVAQHQNTGDFIGSILLIKSFTRNQMTGKDRSICDSKLTKDFHLATNAVLRHSGDRRLDTIKKK